MQVHTLLGHMDVFLFVAASLFGIVMKCNMENKLRLQKLKLETTALSFCRVGYQQSCIVGLVSMFLFILLSIWFNFVCSSTNKLLIVCFPGDSFPSHMEREPEQPSLLVFARDGGACAGRGSM